MLQQEYHFFKRASEMLRLTGLRYETTKVMQPDDQRNAAWQLSKQSSNWQPANFTERV